MLDEHLVMLEEAKKRDHRKLGRELELFMITPKSARAAALAAERDGAARDAGEPAAREQRRRGYQPVVTPHIGNLNLYRTSGHYPYYADSQFTPISARRGRGVPAEADELPAPLSDLREQAAQLPRPAGALAEFGTVYRYEKSGQLNGLTRVRGFTQDDAHLFVRPDQVQQELHGVLDLVQFVMSDRSTSTTSRSGSPIAIPSNKEKYVGSDELWETAEQAIQDAAEAHGLRLHDRTSARRRSTDRSSTSWCATRSAASGSSARCSSTTTCRSASTWNTREQMAQSTAR